VNVINSNFRQNKYLALNAITELEFEIIKDDESFPSISCGLCSNQNCLDVKEFPQRFFCVNINCNDYIKEKFEKNRKESNYINGRNISINITFLPMKKLLIITDNRGFYKFLSVPEIRNDIYFRICFIFKGKAKTIIKYTAS
jgi:hypothetical protein